MNANLYPRPVHQPVRQVLLSTLAWLALGVCAAEVGTDIALPYRSVFSDYQKFSDEPVAPWQQTNATVEKIGGWRVYAKEARQPETEDKAGSPNPNPNPNLNATPNTGAHGGHGGKP